MTSHRKNRYIFFFFSDAHEMFSRIDYILGHKTSLNKCKRIETISSIFFWPQWYETRNQIQEKKCGKHKHGDTTQHATKKLISQ